MLEQTIHVIIKSEHTVKEMQELNCLLAVGKVFRKNNFSPSYFHFALSFKF